MRLLSALCVISSLASAQALVDRIQARVAGFQGEVFLFAKNLDSGATFGLRENEKVRTASTIKLPILLAVFDQVEQGKASWDERLKVTAGERVSGSGILGTEISNGVELPLRDVANLMIVLSDNTATNLILERIGADAVNAYLDKLGLKDTRSLRKIRGDGTVLKAPSGWSAAGRLPENQKYGIGVSTPREMVAILERCQDDSGVRRRIAAPIANKTGALDALRSDVAIVYTPGGRIAMAITVDGMPKTDYTPDNAGSILIADLARLLVEGLAVTRHGKP
jgi:beta-lactamase class A